MQVTSNEPEPIEGDAPLIAKWAETYHSAADEMDSVRSRLSFIEDLRGFKSTAIDAIDDAATEVRTSVADVSDLYRTMGRALSTYAKVLAEEQPVARRAAEEFYAERDKFYRAEQDFGDFTNDQYAGREVDLDDGARYRATMGNATVAMEEAMRTYRAAVLRVDRAGKSAARQIDDVADTTNLYDNSSFVRFRPVRGVLDFMAGEFMDEYAKNLDTTVTLGGILPKGAGKAIPILGWISLATTESNNWAHAARGDITSRDAAKQSLKNLTLKEAERLLGKGADKLGDNVRKVDVPEGVDPPKAGKIEEVVVNVKTTAVVETADLTWGGILGADHGFDPTQDPAYKAVQEALSRGGREFVNYDGYGVEYGTVKTPALVVGGQQVAAGRMKDAIARDAR